MVGCLSQMEDVSLAKPRVRLNLGEEEEEEEEEEEGGSHQSKSLTFRLPARRRERTHIPG